MHVFSETLNILKAALSTLKFMFSKSFIISDMPLDIGLVYLAW